MTVYSVQVLIELIPIYTTEGKELDINVNNLHNYTSTWETVKRRVLQVSVLGPLLFTTYINDLPRHINQFTNVVLFADYTSILIIEKIMKTSTKRLCSL
jgi:hypothetical protein